MIITTFVSYHLTTGDPDKELRTDKLLPARRIWEEMKVKEESKKVGLKLNIQKIKIMLSSPITSWEIDGETVADFIFGGLQNHCRW